MSDLKTVQKDDLDNALLIGVFGVTAFGAAALIFFIWGWFNAVDSAMAEERAGPPAALIEYQAEQATKLSGIEAAMKATAAELK